MISASTRPVQTALPQTPPALRRLAKFVAFATLFLVFAGAMVTSTGSGLAVPDWPLAYGMVFPPMIGGIFYEHGHRLVAATVGFLTVLQAVLLQLREPKAIVRRIAWTAVAAVIAQGLLGGLTVILLLPPAVSIAHAGLAEIFFCLNVSTAFFTSKWYESMQSVERCDAPVGMTTAVVAIVYLQILVGALMRHLGAGLAIPDFPLSFGHLIPPMSSTGVAANFSHRVGALCVMLAIGTVAFRLRRFHGNHPLTIARNMLLVVVPTQVILGAFTIWSAKQPIVTSFHVMTGAATLALSLILMLTARTVAWRRAEQSGPIVAAEVTA